MLTLCLLVAVSTTSLPTDDTLVLPADLERQVDAVFEDYARSNVPGCAIAVAIDGKIAFEKGYGSADLEHDVPILPDTVFDIGSTSKQFTAAAIALLEGEGKLSLDDDIRKHLPNFPDYGVPIRIRHLVFHTSGIRDYNVLLTLDGQSENDWSTDHLAMLSLERQRGLCFPPGTKHEYSNSGYFLLAQIVQRVAGRPFSEFVQERIFDRLAMSDSHVHDDRTRIVNRRAISYMPLPDDRFGISMSGWEQTGDGAVMTTVRDLMKWTHEFETHAVFGDDFHTRMNRVGSLDDGTPLHYGMGLTHRDFRDLDLIEHGGAWVGYRAHLGRLPQRRLAIAMLANRGDFDSAAAIETVLSILIPSGSPEIGTPEPGAVSGITLDREAVEPWLGAFRHPATGEVATLAIEGDTLVAKRDNGTVVLTCLGPLEFVNPKSGTKYLLEKAPTDGKPRVVVRPTTGPERSLETYTPWRPTQAELEKFVGVFHSDEVLAPAIVTVGASGLRVHLGSKDPNDAAELPPLETDAFGMPGFQVRFARDREGRPSSFEFITRSVSGLIYQRTAESTK